MLARRKARTAQRKPLSAKKVQTNVLSGGQLRVRLKFLRELPRDIPRRGNLNRLRAPLHGRFKLAGNRPGPCSDNSVVSPT
ncbi:hypothetical protein BURKHO8Y_70158 [Burkholderia sp. 8Y]|nr:hypothetical protein BURKHO8Y_70158 [Burkholderia sp. 8Y]